MPRIWADGGHCSRSIYGRGSLCHNETGGCSAYLGGLLLMDWTGLGFICGDHAALDTIVSLLIVEGEIFTYDSRAGPLWHGTQEIEWGPKAWAVAKLRGKRGRI